MNYGMHFNYFISKKFKCFTSKYVFRQGTRILIQYIIIHSQSPSRFLHLRFSNIEIFTFIFSILSGEPGMQGERGPPGVQGPKGMQGDSGEVGVTYIRVTYGRKNCPNSGATLVYEGNIKALHPLFTIIFSGEQAMGGGGGGGGGELSRTTTIASNYMKFSCKISIFS